MCPQCFETGGQHDQIYPPDKKKRKMIHDTRVMGKTWQNNRREERKYKEVDNKHRKQKGKIFGWS